MRCTRIHQEGGVCDDESAAGGGGRGRRCRQQLPHVASFATSTIFRGGGATP
jgi:hypothetical protein